MIDISGASGRLKAVLTHLTGYLSAARCAKIDNLDTTMLSRAAASTAVSNAYYTNARGTLLDKLSTGTPAAIKTVQYGTISLTGTDQTATATVTAVTTAKAVLIPLGCSSTGGELFYGVRLALTNTTTITATRETGANSGISNINFVLVEFY